MLLVEDDDGVRDLARLILSTDGFQVLVARDGNEAIAVAERHPGPIHVLVSAAILPKMSGRQVALQLWRRRQDTKVLFLICSINEMISPQDVHYPDIAFLQKPFTPASLLQKVREVLAKP